MLPGHRSEMAKRASETGFFDEDGLAISQHPPEHPEEGAHADGNYAGGDGGGEIAAAPRKSFVMKRGWGGMKMVEVSALWEVAACTCRVSLVSTKGVLYAVWQDKKAFGGHESC